MDKNKISQLQNFPIEIQIQIVKSLIDETCYDGFKAICSVNSYFKEFCKTNLNSLKPSLNRCIFLKRLRDFGWSETETKHINDKTLDYIITLPKENRQNLINNLQVLSDNKFPFDKSNGNIFLTNISYMSIDERKIFISFLLHLLTQLKSTRSFVPFILIIHDLEIQNNYKEYLLNLSCNLIGLDKVLQKILLNPELDLSESFLDFFVKNLKFSINSYIKELDMTIMDLQEEINMTTDPEDREIIEEEYLPIIHKLSARLAFLNKIKYSY